jgi:hypothetical protein
MHVTRCVIWFLVVPAFAGPARAGEVSTPRELPVLRSTRPVVSVQEGGTLRQDAWRLAPDVSPDIYEASLPDGTPLVVTFISDVDRISFTVEAGKSHDFIIQHGDRRCLTRITGVRLVPAAVFDAAYRASHGGKISVEVPEVYELVNIALSLTPTGLADRSLFYQDSAYYKTMRAWFDPYRSHPAITALDAALKASPGYARLKMNGYAFVFDPGGRIGQSPVYDRTSFTSERTNGLRPFIEGLQSFAGASRFRAFYAQNRAIYEAQIDFYRKVAGVDAMRSWLDRNFPRARPYDHYRIIFSPLVAYNQSATWLESNGFRELQAHVNYPYPGDVPRRMQGRNWGLVSLRIADIAPAQEQAALIACVDRMMTTGRGFPRFAAFDAFLLDLYRNRPPGRPLADLFPQIIAWFEKENAGS